MDPSPRAVGLSTPAISPGKCLPCKSKKLDWIRTAVPHPETFASPLNSVAKLAEHAEMLSPCTEELANEALWSLLMPIPLKCLMDQADAKRCLRVAVSTVVTRAKKRAMEEAEAVKQREAAEERKKAKIGAARAAQRAAIFNRPLAKNRVVDKLGRSHVW